MRAGKGTTEDEMVGWHHWLNGHEIGQTLGDRDREAGHAAVHRAQRVGHYLVTEQQQKGPPENKYSVMRGKKIQETEGMSPG